MLKNIAKCAVITVVTHLVFFCCWFVSTKMGGVLITEKISFLEMVVDIFLPLFLLVFLFIKKISPENAKKLFVVEILACLFFAFLGTVMDYFNWGFCCGNFFHPDFETKLIFCYLVTINFYSIVGLGIVFQIIILLKKYKK